MKFRFVQREKLFLNIFKHRAVIKGMIKFATVDYVFWKKIHAKFQKYYRQFILRSTYNCSEKMLGCRELQMQMNVSGRRWNCLEFSTQLKQFSGFGIRLRGQTSLTLTKIFFPEEQRNGRPKTVHQRKQTHQGKEKWMFC